MTRVLFFTNRLGGGGAERHLLRVASHLDNNSFRVAIAVARAGGSYERDLPAHVEYVPLHGAWIPSSTGALAAAAWPLRRLAERWHADVVLPVMILPSVLALSALRGTNIPVVPCLQNNPHEKYSGRGGRAVHSMARVLLPRAPRVICLSHGVASAALEHHPGLRAEQMEVIHNAAIDATLAARLEEPRPDTEGRPTLVAVGRLVPQKGYDVMLPALARVHRSVPNLRVWILGEGPLRKELEQQRDALGLRDVVEFLGFRDNPFAYMAAADAFVLSSRFEGFGNVVAEAMACGTAVVSVDCPYGPGEIIDHEDNGLLVPSGQPEALADALCRVLQDPALREQLERGGKARASDFHAEIIAARYGAVCASFGPGAHRGGPVAHEAAP